jgi:hypothetical protein
MRTDAIEETSVVPAWGRFLLRLAAIALPFLTYWYWATIESPDTLNTDCTPILLDLLLIPLVPAGVVALVCAANMVGTRQRYALVFAAVIVIAWVVIAVTARWVLPETSCGLGLALDQRSIERPAWPDVQPGAMHLTHV